MSDARLKHESVLPWRGVVQETLRLEKDGGTAALLSHGAGIHHNEGKLFLGHAQLLPMVGGEQ